MDSILVAFSLLLLVCSIQMASFSPIVEPVLAQNFAPSTADVEFNPNQRSEADEFIRSNGVTSEEIQEYNRLSGFNPPADSQMGEERSLDLMNAIKFWNWNMYDNFRQWITGRRLTTTTYRPVVVINQFDRPAYTTANVIPNRY